MKKTLIGYAIEQLEEEIRVLQLAIEKLREQAAKKPARVRKPKHVPGLLGVMESEELLKR